MFQIISILAVLSQYCSPSVFGSPVPGENDSQYLEVEMERLKPFVETLSRTFNTSVEPCDDYISYVGRHFEGTMSTGNDQRFLKYLFVNYMQKNEELTPSEIKAKTFYESCRANIKKDFLETVKDLNSAQIGHFPPGVAAWNTDKFVLSTSLATFDRIGKSVLFDFKIDMRDGKRLFFLTPIVTPGSLLEGEKDDFAKVFEYFGYTDDEVSTAKEDSVELQQIIKGFVDTKEDYDEVTLGWIKENIPDFDWTQYFDIVGFGLVNETVEILVKKDAIQNIVELLSKTDKKKVINYVFYNFYRKLYSGQKYIYRNGEDECYEETFWYFQDFYINIALKRYLDDHDKINYINVTESVLSALEDKFKDKFVISRHDEFMKIITDPSNLAQKIEDTYKNIEVTSSNLYANMLRISYEISKPRAFNRNILDFSKYVLTNLRLHHKKPRIFMAYYFSKELNNIVPPFENISHCIDMLDQQKRFKSALNTLDYLKASNEDVFENEKQFLEKYELNQNKVLLKLLTQCYIGLDSGFKTTRRSQLQGLVYSLDEFFTEYKCPNEKFVNLREKTFCVDLTLSISEESDE